MQESSNKPPNEAANRRQAAAMAGHQNEPEVARALLSDPDPQVRATAIGALARLQSISADEVRQGLADPHPAVRRRATTVAVSFDDNTEKVDLIALLDDPDSSVAETAAWALGERSLELSSIPLLASMATGHDDPLCREAAVASLGALGDEGGVEAILSAMQDIPAIRRRATLALAPFDGERVTLALETALEDRDWQVRQAAEDILGRG